jgi:hypothetical protein
MVPGMTRYQCLTEAAARTFRAAAAVIVPDADGVPGADRDEVIRLADEALARRPAGDRKKLLLFLGAVEKLPILRYGRPFSKLPLDKRQRVLEFFGTSEAVPKLRQGYYGLKTFVLMGFYGSERSFAELGYPGPRLDAPYYQKREPS